MEAFKDSQLELALPSTATSYQEVLEFQKNLFCSQIDQLENIVVTQCKLTGVNPLSQEMAAGALSIKIGKRPRDLLNPKAVKYMQEIFSIKDAISKKEIREISALFGVTATQVRDFFNSQRSRVRKFIRLSREKTHRSNAVNELHDGVSSSSGPSDLVTPVPLNSLDPVSVEEGPACPPQEEVLPGIDESDKHFLQNIFILMRKEETFSGQVKLMDWILEVQNPSVLYWFLTKGGVMILATWLTQAAVEEQTSLLYVILKVLCHLPLQKALPVHMSAILQSVNKLRFYRASDISNRARVLLSRWSKMFARSQALKKPNGTKSANDVQDEMLLKQSINEVMSNDTWDSKLGLHEGTLITCNETSDNSRKFESPQPFKMLTSAADESNKKLVRGGLSSHARERRKVQMVEQPGQKTTGRSSQVTKSMASTQGRPLSADDIQKAKMRAQFLQSKYGKTNSSCNESPQLQPESSNKCTSSVASILVTAPKASVRPKAEDHGNPNNLPSSAANKEEILGSIIFDSEEPLWKRCKRVQILWKAPPGVDINMSWKVGSGENSKEVEVQRNRNRRERETIYKTSQEVPPDPKEPWDREIDYDDSLTPEIPIEQLPDVDGAETNVSPREDGETTVLSASTSSQNCSGSPPEPDLELLAVLLKNPDLVFALTSGQAGNLSSEDTVKLLDMIKEKELNSIGSVTGVGRQAEKVEVSLPSPTPSSDPVTSGWKNPFSRQTMASLGRDAPVMHSQELTARSLVQPQIPNSIFGQQSSMEPHVARERLQQASFVQPSSVSLERQQPLMMSDSSLASLSHMLLPASELNMRNVTTSCSPNITGLSPGQVPSAMRLQSSPGIMPLRASVTLDMPERHTALPIHRSRTPTPPRPQTLPLPSYEPDPPLSQSWRDRQGSDAVPYYRGSDNQHSYADNVTRPSLMQPRFWDRNGAVDRPHYDSWSPENSPVRSHEYNPHRDYMVPRMNIGHNYTPDRSMARTPGYPSNAGYSDPSRVGNRRWRDRRR